MIKRFLISTLIKQGFKEVVTSVDLRIRYIFPTSELIGRIRQPIRYGGDKLYKGALGTYLFYQIRNDILNGTTSGNDFNDNRNYAF